MYIYRQCAAACMAQVCIAISCSHTSGLSQTTCGLICMRVISHCSLIVCNERMVINPSMLLVAATVFAEMGEENKRYGKGNE